MTPRRLPEWLRQEIPVKETQERARLFSNALVHTVCREARCPNISSCFKNREFTFMILGDTCTRNCRFCAVTKSTRRTTLEVDPDEGGKISRLVKELRLEYVVITSVTRDDLPDGGAGQFAAVIKSIHKLRKDIKIEILIPDFLGDPLSLKKIVDAHPCVVGHNLETVGRLSKVLRPLAEYTRSLRVLKMIKEIDATMVTKSSLMLGLGESAEEIVSAMEDLRSVCCDILVLGQYLSPSKKHYPITKFVDIAEFIKYKEYALKLGFKAVLAEPLARSSYHAQDLYRKAKSI